MISFCALPMIALNGAPPLIPEDYGAWHRNNKWYTIWLFLHARRYGRAKIDSWISRQELDVRRFLCLFFYCNHFHGSGDSGLPTGSPRYIKIPPQVVLPFIFIIIDIFVTIESVVKAVACVYSDCVVSLTVWAKRNVWADLRVLSIDCIWGDH